MQPEFSIIPAVGAIGSVAHDKKIDRNIVNNSTATDSCIQTARINPLHHLYCYEGDSPSRPYSGIIFAFNQISKSIKVTFA